MVRGRHREIAYPARCVNRFELALGATGDPLKVANNLILEQRRRPLVAKGSNHRRIIPHTGTRSRMQTHDLLRYSITSSARPRIVCGIVRPSALAVLRLMTSSNFVGCWTGRSAGLAPLRILSTTCREDSAHTTSESRRHGQCQSRADGGAAPPRQ